MPSWQAGVAVIRVGAATETEMKEKKARVEDALHATRAAVEEGIVPGGGVSLLRATAALDVLKGANDGETTGIKIVRRALEEPLRQIAANAGQEGAVVVENVAAKKTLAYGYNAATEEYGDLVKMGVIDPTKVVHTRPQQCGQHCCFVVDHRCHGHRRAGGERSPGGRWASPSALRTSSFAGYIKWGEG